MKIFDYFKRARTFLVEVRSEFKKVTWPPRKEVYGTTIVVIITVFFFGFYLYGMDVAMSYLAAALTRLVATNKTANVAARRRAATRSRAPNRSVRS